MTLNAALACILGCAGGSGRLGILRGGETPPPILSAEIIVVQTPPLPPVRWWCPCHDNGANGGDLSCLATACHRVKRKGGPCQGMDPPGPLSFGGGGGVGSAVGHTADIREVGCPRYDILSTFTVPWTVLLWCSPPGATVAGAREAGAMSTAASLGGGSVEGQQSVQNDDNPPPPRPPDDRPPE